MILVDGVLIEVETFPNGERHYLDPEQGRWRDAPYHDLTMYWENDQDLIDLMMVKRHFKEVDCHLEIPYMPYSRMDRIQPTGDGQNLFTLASVAWLLNVLSFRSITVWDPHSPTTESFLTGLRSVYPNVRMLSKVMESIGFDPARDRLVYPDHGAYRKYSSMVPFAISTLSCTKTRDFETGQITGMDFIGGGGVKEFLEPGFQALILDDLCSFGGTFKLCSELLRDVGAASVSLLVTHLEQSVYAGTMLDEAIDQVWASDSMGALALNPKVTIYDKEEWA